MTYARRGSSRSTAVLLACATLLLSSCRARESQPETSTTVRDVTPVDIVTDTGISMVLLPGGEFQMGSESGNDDERPVHNVRLSPFLIDKYEVTQELMARVELPNPSHWQDDPQKPVERIRWRDAKVYCNERSLAEGFQPCYDESRPGMPCDFSANGYRLPTEAEWEYAARCGSRGDFDFSPDSDLPQYAVYDENSRQQTQPVGSRLPNLWGLFDMYGNVSEWCQDVYAEDWYARSPVDDPVGPDPDAVDARRVMRGGSWKSSARMCRVAFRQGQRTGDTDACFFTDYCGFRCVRRVTVAEIEVLTGTAPIAPGPAK